MVDYSEKQALPFDVYQTFLEKLKETDKEIYNYLCDMGYLIGNKESYDNTIAKSEIMKNDFSRGAWDRLAGIVRCNNVVCIDTYCSQLKFLQNSVKKQGIILDVGCGNGDTTEWVRKNTQAEVVGIDFSRSMLKEYKKTNPKADCILADSEKLPIKDSSVDQVLMTWFASNADDKKVFSEAQRILKPKGEIRTSSVYSSKGNYIPINALGYEEFARKFMEDIYGTPNVQNTINMHMEFLECRDTKVQNKMVDLARLGLEESYEFSSFPIIPRGVPDLFYLRIPIAIVGKKT